MKKFILGAVLGLALVATPALASTTTGARNMTRLEFANDYARAIDTFQIDGRTFLVQANPVTRLEIATKIYWLQKQLTDQRLAELVQTW